jgi:hypothetical protein
MLQRRDLRYFKRPKSLVKHNTRMIENVEEDGFYLYMRETRESGEPPLANDTGRKAMRKMRRAAVGLNMLWTLYRISTFSKTRIL